MRTAIGILSFIAGVTACLFVRGHWQTASAAVFTRIPPGTDPTFTGPRFRAWHDGVEVDS